MWHDRKDWQARADALWGAKLVGLEELRTVIKGLRYILLGDTCINAVVHCQLKVMHLNMQIYDLIED